ncbi:MAG: hypothetical protein PW734_09040 [Verrucomicrobium sp.]|nr:hypothetical protein [Verrucomicrobium sp.]
MAASALSRESLRLPKELNVPAKIRQEHEAGLTAYFAGHLEESYSHIAAILRHYEDVEETVPAPCGQLYFALLAREV